MCQIDLHIRDNDVGLNLNATNTYLLSMINSLKQ